MPIASVAAMLALGLGVQPAVGGRETTFAFRFIAPETASVETEYEGFYGWQLSARRRRCASPNRWRSTDGDYPVRTRINGRAARPTSIKRGDRVTFLLPPPKRGWCTGHYAFEVTFFNEGDCLKPCPPEVPVGRTRFTVR